MLTTPTVRSFFEINSALGQSFQLITQAMQMEKTNAQEAQAAREAAKKRLEQVVKRPDFNIFSDHAFQIYHDEIGSDLAPDTFKRAHVAPEVDWKKCTVDTAHGSDCLLELARCHPNPAEQRRAIEALRNELMACCQEVGGLTVNQMNTLMDVIEMMNEVSGLNRTQLKKVIDAFVAKHTPKAQI